MNIALFFTCFTWIIGIIILAYSSVFLKGKEKSGQFFIYSILSLIAATGAFNAKDMLVFLMWWGSILILFYAMLSLGSFKTAASGITIVGFGDFCLLLGMGILIVSQKTTSLSALDHLPTEGIVNITAFVLMAVGALAKAGVFGFHNWIVDAAETSPSVTMAFLPASLDKFLGIYLFVKVMTEFFDPSPLMKVIFMAVGALTIIFAVFMALIQHDLKKLLSFHAVSQVGYMVLGIASCTVLGVAGGLFHMLNNTIYKTSLFLNAGNLEYKLGKTELSKLGGLVKAMPVTFFSTLIASLAISGVPPFNGFVSKWMIYQGLVNFNDPELSYWKVIFLIMAMFGSALTLASFIKVIYSVFFGENTGDKKDIEAGEVPAKMWVPVFELTVLCIILGLFAEKLIIKPYIEPIIGCPIDVTGLWSMGIAGCLVLLAIFAGLVYGLLKLPVRRSDPFTGGEKLDDKNKVQGDDFYLTVKDMPAVKYFYKVSDEGGFNFYGHIVAVCRIAGNIFYFFTNRFFSLLINGFKKPEE